MWFLNHTHVKCDLLRRDIYSLIPLDIFFLTNQKILNNVENDYQATFFWNLMCSFDMNIFKAFLQSHKGKASPVSWQPCFSTNHNCLNNLSWGPPKDDFCLITCVLKWRFLKFSYRLIQAKTGPAPWLSCFSTNHDELNTLGSDPSKAGFCQFFFSFWNLTMGFR